METVRFNHSNRSIEILAKIMNSYAIKYECNIRYNSKQNALDFYGDDSHKHAIAYETSSVINAG